MKLRIKVTYEWEEDADEALQDLIADNNYSYEEALCDFRQFGPHMESISKLDTRADNCIHNEYKENIETEWIE